MDNKFGAGVGDTDPDKKGMKGGPPMRAAARHPHKMQKEAHEMGANPASKATSDSQGTIHEGLCKPDPN